MSRNSLPVRKASDFDMNSFDIDYKNSFHSLSMEGVFHILASIPFIQYSLSDSTINLLQFKIHNSIYHHQKTEL